MYAIFLGRIITDLMSTFIPIQGNIKCSKYVINCMALNFENDIGKVLAKMILI